MKLVTRFMEKQLKNQSCCNLFLEESCYALFQDISPCFDKYLLIEVYQVSEHYFNPELNLNPGIILKEPRFKNKIFVHYQKLDVLFPLFNGNNALSGFIAHNYPDDGSFVKKSFVGQEFRESLWISNYDKNLSIDTLFITNKPIEAINHFQLNIKEIQHKNVAYLATGDTLYQEQLERIDKFIETHSITRIISILNDNVSGLSFTANLNGHLKSIKKRPCNLLLFDASNICSLPTSTPAELHLWFSSVGDKKKLFKPFYKYNSFLEGKFEIKDFENNKFEVFFPKTSKCHWHAVHRFLNEFNAKEIINHFPFFGNFTEDLKQFTAYYLKHNL